MILGGFTFPAKVFVPVVLTRIKKWHKPSRLGIAASDIRSLVRVALAM
jgi:hypothetical protein